MVSFSSMGIVSDQWETSFAGGSNNANTARSQTDQSIVSAAVARFFSEGAPQVSRKITIERSVPAYEY